MSLLGRGSSLLRKDRRSRRGSGEEGRKEEEIGAAQWRPLLTSSGGGEGGTK